MRTVRPVSGIYLTHFFDLQLRPLVDIFQ